MDAGGDRPPADGRLAAARPSSAQQLLAPDTRDADVSRPYPFFLAYPLEGAVEDLGDIAEWQVEVEMGRHPRAVDPARLADVPLVARRGADHRSLPRTGGARRAAARGHRDRWRGAAVEGRRAAAVRADAAAHRAQGAGPQDPGRGAGGAGGLRSAGARTARTCASGRWSGGGRSLEAVAPPAERRWCSRRWSTAASWEELARAARGVARAQASKA